MKSGKLGTRDRDVQVGKQEIEKLGRFVIVGEIVFQGEPLTHLAPRWKEVDAWDIPIDLQVLYRHTTDIGIVDQEIYRFNSMLLEAHSYRIQEWGPGLTLAEAMCTNLACIEKHNCVMLWVLIEVRDQLCHVHGGHVP